MSSTAWTEERQVVEQEKQRLLTMQIQLASLVSAAQHSDGGATWYLMAGASLHQLDRDIDDLFDWLELDERCVKAGADTRAL
ncbi:MAG: hypothetical protein ABL916_00475 [Burkholderiaceae bacterium]